MYYDIIESGKRIKEMRKKMGMTQEQLAEKLNVSVNTIGNIERGSNGTTLDLMGMMAVIFDSSVDYLAFGRNVMELSDMEMRVVKAMRE